MTAYYNEIDPFNVEWIRNLIAAGHIAPGDVDDRSIEDVCPADIVRYKQCHFFAGISVWSLALRSAGVPDDYEVWTGSCPCQPFSAVGKGEGFADERHLWPSFHWLIKQCRPKLVIGEQVAGQDGLEWLDLVSADLQGEGYAFGAADTCAAGFGMPHKRQRLYWVAADAGCKRSPRSVEAGGIGEDRQGRSFGPLDMQQIIESPYSPGRYHPQPLLRSVDDGFASAMGGLYAAGNAITLGQAQGFVEAVMECMP